MYITKILKDMTCLSSQTINIEILVQEIPCCKVKKQRNIPILPALHSLLPISLFLQFTHQANGNKFNEITISFTCEAPVSHWDISREREVGNGPQGNRITEPRVKVCRLCRL